ncbi:MAG: response regulator [Spirochaetaceae bacterium]|nr:response regulator [Spirochaetaceae bacterium]
MQFLVLIGVITGLVLGLAGCKPAQTAETYPVYASYRDIPGITEEEIRGIEALREQVSSFSYGMSFSTEAFYCGGSETPGAVGGYAALFCRWLTDLFDIPFIPGLYGGEELSALLREKTLDFTGEITILEENTEEINRYYVTDPIARRLYKSFRLKGVSDWFLTEEDDDPLIPRYGFQANTPSLTLIPPLLKGRFSVVTFRTYDEAYRLLKTGEIDLFFADETKEAAVAEYQDLASDYFFPQIHRFVAFSTQNPELAPIVSAVQKYLDHGAFYHLVNLYNQGRQDYQRYQFFKELSGEEAAYLKTRQSSEEPVKVVLQYDNYPVSFYNEQDRQWQGIVPDILEGIADLTGLDFAIINDKTEDRPLLLDKLASGEASVIAELIYSRYWEDQFIWADTPYLRDSYALLSRSDYPDVTIYNLVYTRVGSVANSVYAQRFKDWFPQHTNFVEYDNHIEGFNALEKGEIDLLMTSGSLLLMITNYYERAGFKVNFVFDRTCNSQFGFNKRETTLQGIINKAQRRLNTDLIADRWSRRVFDYRSKLARAQVPYFIGASILLSAMLILLTVLFFRTRYLKMHLEETVQKRTQELEVQTNLAKAASKAKSEFLASMSHEIRTPMNVIIGMSDLMRIDNLDGVQRDYFMNIKKMSKALLQIINDILDFSKIEAGKLEIIPVHYNILALFDNVCSMIRFTAMGKELEFRYCCDSNIPPALFGDEVRVRQVITNILSNAVKYTAKGSVTFKAERISRNGKDCIAFIVEDTGRGIKKEDFSKIFGAFQQVDNEKNRGIVGTGLGLSITRLLVNMMGGEITVDSEYGKGSVFRVCLPLIAGDPDKIERVQITQWIIAKEDVSVLVVDDNSINLTVALGFLSAHKISADTALSGQEAIEKARKKQYDIIFMDHMMPEMDGIETAQHIRSLEGEWFKKMPIIALSANAVSGACETFFEGGMNDFLSKPIEADKLNLMLVRWLPPEKIAKINTQTPQTGKTGEYDSILQELEQIEGLDTAAALSHMANQKAVYVKILRQFCHECDPYLDEIRRFLTEENWKEYAIRVHGIKGVLANIGMEGLSKKAYTLEYAAKNGDYDACRAGTDSFCEAMTGFKADVLKTSLMDKPEPSEKTQGDKSFLREKLKALEEACAKGLSDSADAAAAELGAMQFSPNADASISKIIELIESLDYDMAAEEIRRLQESLGSD